MMMMMRSLHPPHFTALFLVWACRITVVAGSFQPILPARTTLARGSSYSTSRQFLLEDTTPPSLALYLPRWWCSSSSSRHGQEQRTKMKEDDDDEETQQRAGTEDEFWSTRKEKSFNPFDYNASSLSGSSRSHGSTTTARSNTVSLRSIQMKALNERLFAAASSDERRTILTEEQDMLLAPILDGDTAVGWNNNNNGGDSSNSSSIYQQCRSSEERFVAFDTNLTERIHRAQSAVVKTILQEMKDFVMSQQP
jgi:hypothetical protein